MVTMRSAFDLLYNFHWIERGMAARAAQAYAGFLGPFLRRRGIRAVINLRGANPGHSWWRYETRICAQSGIAHRDVKLNSRQLPTREMLLDLLRAFDDAPRPFLLKCSGGQDRTSLAAALYLLHTHGMAAQASAVAQFSAWPYLHLPGRQQRWLKSFVPFAVEQAEGRPVRSWLETDYSAQVFKGWLEARGQGETFRGLYNVPGSIRKR
jgi:hypothetical protein